MSVAMSVARDRFFRHLLLSSLSRTAIWYYAHHVRCKVSLYILYLLHSRTLLEKLTGFQLVQKISEFYGTRRFVVAFTSARHLFLSCAKAIQSMPTHPTSWRSILILSSHLRLGLQSGLFPSGFPTKALHTPLLFAIHATSPTLAFLIWSPEQYWVTSTDH